MSGYWYSEGNKFEPNNLGSNFVVNNDEFVGNSNNLNFHDSVFKSGSSDFVQLNPPNDSYSFAYEYDYNSRNKGTSKNYQDFDEEPPLLEELGIDIIQIVRKTVFVLHPFKSAQFGDYELAGPLGFCVTLAVFLLISGGKANFGYVYGLAVTSCILMYILLKLMTCTNEITFLSVASVLGYALLPIVILSGSGILISLKSSLGLVLAFFAVIWSSYAASRIFVNMSVDKDQQPLIAYPCALLYSVFVLLVIF